MDFAYRASLFYNRGLSRAYLGDLDGAIADFTRALQDRPNFAEAYNNRGFTYAKQGQLAPAQSDLENALAINPNLSEARQTLAKVVQLRQEGARPPATADAPGRGPAGGLIDEWETRSASLGHRYQFRPDGTYAYTIFRVEPGRTTPVEVKREPAWSRATGSRYASAVGPRRRIVGASAATRSSRARASDLSLSGPQGEQQFSGSSR